MADCCQVTTTVATQADAERIAAALVEERLAACVQVAGPIISTYRWQGAVERATEWYCHCKTTRARYPALEARLRDEAAARSRAEAQCRALEAEVARLSEAQAALQTIEAALVHRRGIQRDEKQ